MTNRRDYWYGKFYRMMDKCATLRRRICQLLSDKAELLRKVQQLEDQLRTYKGTTETLDSQPDNVEGVQQQGSLHVNSPRLLTPSSDENIVIID